LVQSCEVAILAIVNYSLVLSFHLLPLSQKEWHSRNFRTNY
jgi:hypothetical protein